MSLALVKSAHPRTGTVPVWDPLNAADRAMVRRIMADHLVLVTMRRAWAATQRDAKERSFWIYRKKPSGFGTGQVWIGSGHATPREAYVERLVLGDSPDAVVANYHTHPGSNWWNGHPSSADANYNRLSGTIGFLQTEFGFTAGRSNHLERRSGP